MRMESSKKKYCIAALVPGEKMEYLHGIVTRTTSITKFSSQKSSTSTCERFSFVFSDDTTDIKVTVFGEDIQSLRNDVCRDGEVVRISGGRVIVANREWNTTENQYELIVNVGKGVASPIIPSEEQVTRHGMHRILISDLGCMDMQKKVDILGTITSVEEVSQTKTKEGKDVSIAKVTLVDESNYSVSCVFWASSARQVNDWSTGEVLAIRGASVGTYDGETTLNCTRAEVEYKPDNEEASNQSTWFADKSSSQQLFERMRPRQKRPIVSKEAADDEIVTIKYPRRMFNEFNKVKELRVCFGDKTVLLDTEANGLNYIHVLGYTRIP